jgi:hypothetical protein
MGKPDKPGKTHTKALIKYFKAREFSWKTAIMWMGTSRTQYPAMMAHKYSNMQTKFKLQEGKQV